MKDHAKISTGATSHSTCGIAYGTLVRSMPLTVLKLTAVYYCTHLCTAGCPCLIHGHSQMFFERVCADVLAVKLGLAFAMRCLTKGASTTYAQYLLSSREQAKTPAT